MQQNRAFARPDGRYLSVFCRIVMVFLLALRGIAWNWARTECYQNTQRRFRLLGWGNKAVQGAGLCLEWKGIKFRYWIFLSRPCESESPFIDHWSMNQWTHPSIHRASQPTIHPSIHPPTYPTIQLSIHPAIIHPPNYPSIYLSIHPSIHLSIHRSIDLSMDRSIHRYSHPSSHPFIYPSTNPFISSSI